MYNLEVYNYKYGRFGLNYNYSPIAIGMICLKHELKQIAIDLGQLHIRQLAMKSYTIKFESYGGPGFV